MGGSPGGCRSASQLGRFAAFAKDYFRLGAPGLVESDERPGNLWREVLQHGIHGRMHTQRRDDEIQQRRMGQQRDAREISVLLQLSCSSRTALLLQPVHANPVIQALERKM